MVPNRIQRAQAALAAQHLDACIIERPEDIGYFLYDEAVSGTLLISKTSSVFFVSPMDHALYASLSQLPLIFCDQDVNAALLAYIQKAGYTRVGFDSQHTSYQRHQSWEKFGCALIPQVQFAERLRSIKSSEEIERMRDAANLGSEGYDHVLSLLQEGITEREVVRLLKIFWDKAGAEGTSFSPIIAFGEHAAFPHALTTDRPLRKGDIVLIDIGVLYHGYCSDMTRTVAWGQPDSRLIEGYRAVAEAQEAGIALCLAGKRCQEVHNEVRRVLNHYQLDQYFIHGTGHGVGRNVHEYPRLNAQSEEILQEGMTVTVEPGVYLPGIGGIRLEDTLLITNNENISLTNRPISKEIPII